MNNNELEKLKESRETYTIVYSGFNDIKLVMHIDKNYIYFDDEGDEISITKAKIEDFSKLVEI